MALPASGSISISAIRAELQNTGLTNIVSLRYLGGYESKGVPGGLGVGLVPLNQSSTSKPNFQASPYGVAEWYSYNHTENRSCSVNVVTSPTLSSGYIYHRFSVTGALGDTAQIDFNTYDCTSTTGCQFWIYINYYPFDSSGQRNDTEWVEYVRFFSNTSFTFYFQMTSSTDIVYIVVDGAAQ